MGKDDLVLFKGTKINKEISERWNKTIIHNSKHPIRDRLEEALLDNIEKHRGEIKNVA